MNPYKIAFLIDHAVIHTIDPGEVLLSLFEDLLRENAQIEIFACKDGPLAELCARVDAVDAVFCYTVEESNISAAIRYAEERGKAVIRLDPTEEEKALFLEKQRQRFFPYPGVMFVD